MWCIKFIQENDDDVTMCRICGTENGWMGDCSEWAKVKYSSNLHVVDKNSRTNFFSPIEY